MGRATAYTLATLRDGPLPAALIIERTRELSGGRVSLTVGAVHDALHALTGAGLVEAGSDGFLEERWLRRYRLTGAGEAASTPVRRARPFVLNGHLRLLTSRLRIDLRLTVVAAPADDD
jgi:DNA-binding PadR family transcriptional regulator